MLTMRDFLTKQFATFEELPFGPLDATAFSQMAMTISDGLIPTLDSRKSVHFRDIMLAEHFDAMFNSLDPERTKFDFMAMAASPRYRDVKIRYYEEAFSDNPATQYGAMTFTYKDLFTVVAFRGTDQSLTGWKEDCYMGFEFPIPSQELGRQYLDKIGAKRSLPRTLYVVGHSKGGNIAEYAALTCKPSIQERITCVYEIDAPGFKEGAFTKEDYAPIVDRIYKIIPQDSIVGLLLHSEAKLHIAHSDAKGFKSHSAFTWEVNEDLTDYVYLDKLEPKAKDQAAAILVWADELSDDEFRDFVDDLFKAMKDSGAKDIRPLLEGGFSALGIYLQMVMKNDSDQRAIIIDATRKLIQTLALA